jgi:tetratricopeptide (TPR) repeat protein
LPADSVAFTLLTTMRLALLLAVTFASPALAGPGKGQPAKAEPAPEDPKRVAAKRFYEAGTLLYERGEFADAAKEFERAYGEEPLPAFLYNIGSAYDKAGDRKRAVEAYRKYVAANVDSNDSAVARARADVLEREWKELEAARAAAIKEAAPKRVLPPPLPFVEPVTKHSYSTLVTIDGQPYTLLGAGARKVYGFKVYAMALYIEDDPARKAFPRLAAQAGGSDHDTLVRGDIVHQFVINSEFGKAAQLHFVRTVSGKDTRDAYRDALGDSASAKAPPELKRDAESFLALFDDIKDGEDLIIRTSSEGQIVVEAHGQKRVGPTNQRLARDIWDIWLGPKPISADLKKSLLDRIDTLGR